MFAGLISDMGNQVLYQPAIINRLGFQALCFAIFNLSQIGSVSFHIRSLQKVVPACARITAMPALPHMCQKQASAPDSHLYLKPAATGAPDHGLGRSVAKRG